jgi:hypothetical protein
MEGKELIKVLETALLKNKSVKGLSKYQGEKALQILMRDGTLFNIMPVDVTKKVSNLCK